MQGDFRVGDWLVQPRVGRMSKNGAEVHIRAKVMDVLVFLASRPGEVLSKDALLNGVWATEAISESALTRVITELRQAFADDVGQPWLIETIPKRGYRFIAAVTPVPEPTGETAGRPILVPALIVTLVAVAIGLGFALFGDTKRAPHIPVVAVLPFEATTGAESDEHFADALHQEVILRLGMVSGIKVIDRSSVLRYRDRDVATAEIARDVGADYVLLGTLAVDRARIRFTPVLTDTRRQGDRWTDQYLRDPSVASLMTIRSAVALDVAAALSVKISSAERGRISGRSTENANAYNLFLRAGQVSLDSDPLAASATREVFLKQAIELDPRFAAAMALLAYTYAQRSYTFGQPGHFADEAIRRAREALQIDPALGDGYRALGLAYLDKGQLGEATRAFQRLAELQPSDGQAQLVLGWIHYLKGRVADAMHQWAAARALDPFNQMIYNNLGSAERLLGNAEGTDRWRSIAEKIGGRQPVGVRRLLQDDRVDEALAVARQAAKANPTSVQVLDVAAIAASRAGRFAEARTFLQTMDDIAKDDWNSWGLTYRTLFGYVLLQLGEREDAFRLLEGTRQDALERIRNGDERPGVIREIAAIHAARGEHAAAAEWFDRAVTQGWRLEALHPSPLFDVMRGRPEFQKVKNRLDEDLKRANLEIERRGIRRLFDR